MKRIIGTIFFSAAALFAQEENKSQSIELPDFVITGKESITLPKIQKSSPDFIPLLSKDFFTPEYPSEDETTIPLPKAEPEVLNLGNYKQSTNALLKFNAGLETWPAGEFFYSDWTDNFSFSTHLFGKNELEFVKNAGLSIAGIDLNTKYYIDHNSDFLPGLEISLLSNYLLDSYHFYGSATPSLERSTRNGLADLSFNYYSNPYLNFGLGFNDNYYLQKDDNISENIFGSSGFLKIRISDFDIKLEGLFKNQTLSDPNNSYGNQYYYNTLATIGFNLNEIFNIKAGITFAESEGNTFFAPVAFGSLKLTKSISLFGEFSPYTEFKTLHDFKNANRFYSLNNFVNLFVENKFNIKFAAKYEYEKYFEISAGIGYLNSDNNFYFEDDQTNGFFTIHKQDIDNSFGFVNFLFRKGPFGEFYAEVKAQKLTSQNNKYVPYTSTLLGNINYSIDLTSDFGIKLGLKYFNEAYTDYVNTNKIPQSVDVNAGLYYELFRNFKLTLDFENMLNDKYYYFRNYEAKPFDVLAGFEFRW